jgi:hypothetical membrane protein
VTERPVPWWGLLSASAAPVLLIGGWTVAAAQQPGRFDPAVETISALAARGATDRWIMTVALAGLGICHVVTALALRPAASAGRVVLAGGGVATVLVAAFPLPAGDAGSIPHSVAAGIGFLTLAAWPAVAVRRSAQTPAVLSRPVAVPAAAVLLGLLVWFGVELALDDGRIGLSERAAAGAQAIWPLATVIGTRSAIGRTRQRRRRR